MSLQIQITARNMEMTDAIKSAVHKRAEKLDQFSDRITSLKVVVECPHRHHHKGVIYNVHIDLSLPGAELVVNHEPNEDLYIAIKMAFDAARRQLLQYNDKAHDRGKNQHNKNQQTA